MTPWYRLPFGTFIAKEIGRTGFREFAIGAGVVFFGLAVPIQLGITDEDRKNSPYYQDFIAPKKSGHGDKHGH